MSNEISDICDDVWELNPSKDLKQKNDLIQQSDKSGKDSEKTDVFDKVLDIYEETRKAKPQPELVKQVAKPIIPVQQPAKKKKKNFKNISTKIKYDYYEDKYDKYLDYEDKY